MKTIAIKRAFAIIVIAAIAFANTSAQRDRKNERIDTKKELKVKVKKQPKKTNAYTYRNYNYLHQYNAKPIIVAHSYYPEQRVYKQRIPQPYKSHLRVQIPKDFVALHIDGERYFVNKGQYFKHVPNRGFIMVERPRHIKILPAGAVRVRINGNFYFRYHNIYFKWTPRGYRIV
jgi:hypothetical protein